MKLGFEVHMPSTFMHTSGQFLCIDKLFVQEYNENSDEYKDLCKQYEEGIGFSRKQNKEQFDKQLMSILLNQTVQEFMRARDSIIDGFRKKCSTPDMTGFIDYNGWTLDIKDFSAVNFGEIKTKINNITGQRSKANGKN